MTEFYDVPDSARLFRDAAGVRPSTDAKWTPAEESVRQWCLQELIRSYGVRVDCLEIERQVKVARERHPHRIDIVVLREGRPYVVIECKARGVKKLDGAMQQGTNYAAILGPDVAFAVATNGDQWLVQRRIGDNWVPVADLPDFRLRREATEWRLIHMAVNAVMSRPRQPFAGRAEWATTHGREDGHLGGIRHGA